MGLKRCALLILFGLATLLASHSEPLPEDVSLSIRSFPPCQVYLDTATGLTLLGYSGKTLRVAPPVLRDPQGRAVQYAGGLLVLRAENHADLRVTVAAQDWMGGQLPGQGQFRLPPDSALVAGEDYLRAYPLISLGLVAALLAGGWRAWRWMGQAKRTAAEVKVLSSRLEIAGDPLIGKSIGRYRVEERLGQGGMGAVYRVVDDAGEYAAGEYAAKVIYLDSLEQLDRFRREFRLLSQLQHPTFPRCFDYQEQGGMACCIMELVHGRTLRELIGRGGLPWSIVRPWIRSILEGLDFAHEKGIVHRDLKPENIMLEEGQVKILDLGLARKSQMTAITMTGQAFGTPAYIAPEQVHASGTEVDRRTDLYSLGVILFELLSGAPPFEGERPEELVQMHLHRPAPPLDIAGLPEGVAEVVAVLLAKNPANRYASARRVLEVLDGIGASSQQQDTAVVNPPSE